MTLEEGLAQIQFAIRATWDEIAADAYELCEGDNAIAVEFVLDANRMTFAGFEEEDLVVAQLCATYGWNETRAYVAKHIQLL